MTEPRRNRASAPNITKRADFAAHYVNWARLMVTTFDVSVIFGQIASPTGVEQLLQVTMSYQHAKAVAKLISKYVAAYERENNICFPEDDQPRHRGRGRRGVTP